MLLKRKIVHGTIQKWDGASIEFGRFIMEVDSFGERYFLRSPDDWGDIIKRNLNLIEKFIYRRYPVGGNIGRMKVGARIIFEFKVIYGRNYIVKIHKVK